MEWTHKIKLIGLDNPRQATKMLVYDISPNGLQAKPGYCIEHGGPFGVMTVGYDSGAIEAVDIMLTPQSI